jgi:hypothetical protein
MFIRELLADVHRAVVVPDDGVVVQQTSLFIPYTSGFLASK